VSSPRLLPGPCAVLWRRSSSQLVWRRQQSSKLWLSLRPASARPITSWELDRDNIAKPPKGTTHVVLDTAADPHGKRLRDILKLAHKVVVPLQPSVFDVAPERVVRDLASGSRSASGWISNWRAVCRGQPALRPLLRCERSVASDMGVPCKNSH